MCCYCKAITYSGATKQITAATNISTCIRSHVQPYASAFHIIFTVQPGLIHLLPTHTKHKYT